jgi:uncharacterized membrane protein
MNQRLFLFVIALFFMAALKYALGQDEPVIGWDSVLQDDPIQDVAGVMLAAPILGAICGAFRLLRTNSPRPVLLSLRLR